MEVLERTAADWVFSQDVPSDVTVIVEGTAYALHKLPLASRSGWMRRTVSETADPSLSNIELADLPGGGEAFELAAKFCYGINFEIEATNVAALRCAAEYLEMSEDYAEENLASRTDTYLEEVVVKNLPKAVTVLQACDSLLPMAEELDIVSKCVDAIACKACKEQMTSSLSRSDLGSSGHLEELSSPGNFSQTPKRRTVEWWVEEISVLQIDNFKRVISAMKARGMRNDSIGSAVAFYAQKWMRGLLKKQAGQLVEMRNRARQMKAVHDLAATEEQEQQRRMLETLVSLLPAERGICSVNFLCAMLRVASYLEVSTPWRTEIEKRIGWQLEQAAVDDLLIPSFSQLSEPYFDLDTVSRIVGHFLHEEASGVDDDRGNTTDASAHADYSSGDGGSPPPQSAVMKVAKSLDSLLSEVAPDANLTVSKFVAFAELMPSYARVVDDGIYRAVDIYLKSHPGVSDLERKKVAGLMDCQKLSQEACTHAAQNDRLGQLVHHHVVECGYGWESLLRNCIMHMYGKCGLVEDAKATFNQLPNQDSYSWNILINLCGHNHGYEQAKSVFNMMPSPNVVSWNALMTLLIKHEQYKQALEAFSCMQNKSELPNEVTLICATDACSALRSLQNGLQLHVRVRSAGHENKIVVGTSLINMYGSCGCLQHVKSIFNNLSSQDVVSWTAMIGCLSGNGCNEEALELFKSMQSHKIPPNDITFICVMEACAESALLKDGMDIHTLVIVQSFEYHVKVCNALIDMYGKCGSLQSAWKVFKTMGERTLVTWNAMIVAFGQHGAGEKAMTLFWKMQRDGLKPDGITFTALMNACSHAGLVQDGWLLFHHVHDAYRYAHESDQYICIIDLLGRAGRLEEAEEVILKSPARSELVAWLCLLAACKLHGDVDRGLYAASCCFKFDKTFAAPYIVLSNIYMELLFSEP